MQDKEIYARIEASIQTLKNYSAFTMRLVAYRDGEFVYQAGEGYRTRIIATIPRQIVDFEDMTINPATTYSPEELAGRGLELIYIIDKLTGKTIHSYWFSRHAVRPVSSIQGIRDAIVNTGSPPPWINE